MMYSSNYAAGDDTERSLEESKKACAENAKCAAVTCKGGGETSCTLRASPNLTASPFGEDSYQKFGIKVDYYY